MYRYLLSTNPPPASSFFWIRRSKEDKRGIIYAPLNDVKRGFRLVKSKLIIPNFRTHIVFMSAHSRSFLSFVSFFGKYQSPNQCVQILRFRAKVALFASSLRLDFSTLRKAQNPQKVALFKFLAFLCSKI